MSGGMSHAAKAEPNLTPMLDMVFQLITFFMLVINFKTAALDLSLHLPVVGSAAPVEGEEQLLILNICHYNKDKPEGRRPEDDGALVITGVIRRDVEAYIAIEAQADLIAARVKNPKLVPGEELPTTVVIRADRATPFGQLNRVIQACQKNGYRKFAMKAASRDKTS